MHPTLWAWLEPTGITFHASTIQGTGSVGAAKGQTSVDFFGLSMSPAVAKETVFNPAAAAWFSSGSSSSSLPQSSTISVVEFVSPTKINKAIKPIIE